VGVCFYGFCFRKILFFDRTNNFHVTNLAAEKRHAAGETMMHHITIATLKRMMIMIMITMTMQT